MAISKSVLGLALLVGVAFVPVAPAQVPAAAPPPAGPTLTPPTIALVDMQRVVLESAAGRNIQSQLDTERRKIRDQLARLDEELKNGENELRRQRSVLSQDALNEQYQALQRKQADAQRIQQDRQEAFQKGQNDAVNVVLDNMRDIVQQLAAERRITLVLRKEVAITMSDKNMDITDDVIQRLNTKLPSVTVTIPAPGSASAGPVAGSGGVSAPAAPPAKSTKK
jgi:Skp family chaperone for outer membrane proteins